MKTRKTCLVFWASFAVALIVLAAVFVVLVCNVGKGRMITDVWMAQNYWLKTIFAERAKGPKILLFGGSATAFSVDSKVIEEMCGMPVVNLGLHAGLPFRFCLEDVKRYVRKGDIVVVALEPGGQHYGSGEEKIYSDLSISALFGMAPELQRTLTVGQLLQLYSGYGCKWIDHAISRTRPAAMSRSSVIDAWETERKTVPAGGTIRNYGYVLHYINEHGDRLMPMGQMKALRENQCSKSLTTEFLSVYDSLRKIVAQKGARLCMTYPNLFSYPDYTGLTSLRNLLGQYGIVLWGSPQTLCFPAKYYYDTSYHMTGPGAALYSRELAKTVCKFAGLPYELSASERVVSFQEHPEVIHASGVLRWYDYGITVTNQSFSVSVARPEGIGSGRCVYEFLLDRGKSAEKVIEEVRLNGQKLPVEEVVRKAKNQLLVLMPKDVDAAKLDFLLKNGAKVGMERIFIDEDDFDKYSFQRYDGKIPKIVMGNKKGIPNVREGMWTDGNIVEMDMSLNRLHKWDGVYTLVFSCCSIIAGQEVSVSCQGQELAVWRFADKTMQQQDLSIPAELVDNGVAKLIFNIKKTVCPAEAGTSTDKRHLGIRFISARLIDRESDFGGDRFTFTSIDENITKVGGFSIEGPNGLWTDGDVAVLGMRLNPKCARNGEYRLSYSIAPIVTGQEVQVLCGNKELAVWKFNNRGVQPMEVVVPESLVSYGKLILEFRMKKVICPYEMGTGRDKRHLGVRFFSAELQEE